jgi:molecular chaperone GrpE
MCPTEPAPLEPDSLDEAAAVPEPGDAPPPNGGADEIAADLERLRARAAEADVLEDRLKRAQADFVNEGKRIARQAEQDRRFAVEQIVKDLVPLAEGLESALAASGDAPAVQPLREGVALVARQLEDMLKRYGIELIRPTGQPFDPSAHEAILMVDREDAAPNSVAEVVRPGFRLHGRVVRPAQVTVVRPPAAASKSGRGGKQPPAADGPDGA